MEPYRNLYYSRGWLKRHWNDADLQLLAMRLMDHAGLVEAKRSERS